MRARCRHITVLLLLLVNASLADSGEDVFAGCYSLIQGGATLLKVEKSEDTWFASLRDNDGWKERTSLHAGTQQELAKLFEKDSNRVRSSLVADKGPFALFHVQTEETYNGYKAKTDYLVYILTGAGSAYRKDCVN